MLVDWWGCSCLDGCYFFSVTFCQNARCYDATCDVRGQLISSGVSARHCCLELSAGRAYDFGGNQESCHTCEGECIYNVHVHVHNYSGAPIYMYNVFTCVLEGSVPDKLCAFPAEES